MKAGFPIVKNRRLGHTVCSCTLFLTDDGPCWFFFFTSVDLAHADSDRCLQSVLADAVPVERLQAAATPDAAADDDAGGDSDHADGGANPDHTAAATAILGDVGACGGGGSGGGGAGGLGEIEAVTACWLAAQSPAGEADGATITQLGKFIELNAIKVMAPLGLLELAEHDDAADIALSQHCHSTVTKLLPTASRPMLLDAIAKRMKALNPDPHPADAAAANAAAAAAVEPPGGGLSRLAAAAAAAGRVSSPGTTVPPRAGRATASARRPAGSRPQRGGGPGSSVQPCCGWWPTSGSSLRPEAQYSGLRLDFGYLILHISRRCAALHTSHP